MNRTIRPVSIGLLLGLLALLFGIFWAMYITVNHERLHAAFREGAAQGVGHRRPPAGTAGQDPGASTGRDAHDMRADEHELSGHGNDTQAHDHGEAGTHKDRAEMMDGKPAIEAAPADAHGHGMHEEPAEEEAHERLAKGHVHAMGLGILTICVSLVISMTAAPRAWKTLASACLGVGALLYPAGWIIMGFRTPFIGAEAAQESVFPIAALSVVLVLAGLLICLFYVLKGMASGENV